MMVSVRGGGNTVFRKVGIDSLSEEGPNMMRPDQQESAIAWFLIAQAKGRERKTA